MNQSERGTTVYRLADELKIPERKIMDFSTPVNPMGVSNKVKAEIRKHLKYLNRYPDDDAIRLRNRLGQHHGIDPETILCGSGSTELIHLALKAFSPRRAVIPAPTRGAYEQSCKMNGVSEIIRYGLKKENNFEMDVREFIKTAEEALSRHQSSLITDYASPSSGIVFLCNPNYPTGRLLKKQAVKYIADAARRLECYLVVDEAYMDFSPEDSVIAEAAGNPCLIVLRSLSYYYALAGLRFGYGVFPARCIERLKEFRVPRMVNSLAQKAAAAALKDKAYKKNSSAMIRQEKAFLEKSFRKLGLAFIPSDANFYLVNTASAPEICRRLRSKGMLVGDCSDLQGLGNSCMCIAVKSHRENALLIREMARILAAGE